MVNLYGQTLIRMAHIRLPMNKSVTGSHSIDVHLPLPECFSLASQYFAGFSVSLASVVYHVKASTSSHYINYPPIDSRQRPETGIVNSLGLLLKQTVVYPSNLTDTYRNCINTCIGLGG